MLIEVGHAGNKPSLYCFLEIYLRSIGIDNWGELVAGLEVLGCFSSRASITSSASIASITRIYREAGHGVAAAILFIEPLGSVQPVFAGHIGSPRMLKTTVIKDHIHHNLQALLMSLIAEAFIVLV